MKFIGTWWRKNRPKAATLFADELDTAIDEIAKDPFLGELNRCICFNC